MIHRRNVCLGIAATFLARLGMGQDTPTPAPKLDAEATGKWIASLFEVRDGEIYIATRDLAHLPDIRYKVSEGTEIKPLGSGFSIQGVIIDQPELYPVEIDCSNLGRGLYQLNIDAPFLYLMDSLPPDIDPASRGHLKAETIDAVDFRPIAEVLVKHFSQIVGKKAFVLRSVSDMGKLGVGGWPSEVYLWEGRNYVVLLTAYQANDHSGLSLTVKRPEGEREKLAKRTPSTKEPFKGWGDPIVQ